MYKKQEGDKNKKINQDHPEKTVAEIKKVPQILEGPGLSLKSEGRGKSGANSRLVCFGLTKAQNGQPVMTVMDLSPRENGFVVDDMQKVNSAYTKKNPMAFIQKSDVVYADKKRAIPLLRKMCIRDRAITIVLTEQKGSAPTITIGKDCLLYTSKLFRWPPPGCGKIC